MTRLDVWDRAALGLVSIHMHGSISSLLSGLNFLAPRPQFRTSADDQADRVVHPGTSPGGMLPNTLRV